MQTALTLEEKIQNLHAKLGLYLHKDSWIFAASLISWREVARAEAKHVLT
jgi:hypothetical protein